MKRTHALLWTAAAVSLLIGGGILAEGTPTSRGGWGKGGRYGRMYNPATVETMSGEVTRVERITPLAGMGPGVHALLKTDKETISVHLGPAWFIDRQGLKLAADDRIEVKGSRVTFEGQPAIIAAEVHKGDQVLVLRDVNGVPVWAGGRRR